MPVSINFTNTMLNSFIYRIVLSCLLAVAYSCSAQARPVTKEYAKAIATRFLGNSKSLSLSDDVLMMPSEGDSPAYYIFTRSGGNGFVIISGDDVARPVLAYSYDGAITDGTAGVEMQSVGTIVNGALPVGLQDWFADISRQIAQARAEGGQPTSVVGQPTADDAVGNPVVELNTPTWKQGAPFNALCPFDGDKQCVTGCVPLVYGELMKYYAYPDAGIGRTTAYVTRDNEQTVGERQLGHRYQWDKMPLSSTDEFTAEQADAVAVLLADLGAAFQVQYDKEESAASLGQDALLLNFDYNPGTRQYKSDYTTAEWYASLRSALDAGRPVIYRADNSAGGSHAFIIDGYTDRDYYHVNWGWGGSYNGYFALDALQVSGRDYNSGQAAYFDFMPMPRYTGPFVAQVGDTRYPTLKVAFGAAQQADAPATITLLENTQLAGHTIAAGQAVTIDLNGHDIELTTNIRNDGYLAITDAMQKGGIYRREGNNNLISNYGELHIAGGTYANLVTEYSGTDYRRVIWRSADSHTTIADATIANSATTQTLCFNGDAELSASVIGNAGSGYACLSTAGATVTLEDCWVRAVAKLLYAGTGSELRTQSGLFSLEVAPSFLADGYECVANTDQGSKANYPFRVQPKAGDTEGIVDVTTGRSPVMGSRKSYSLSGLPGTMGSGLRIVGTADGGYRKVLTK